MNETIKEKQKSVAEKEASELLKQLTEANDLYYKNGRSPFTDKEYDQKKERYDFLVGIAASDDVLPSVGSEVKGRCKKKLSAPMLSLKKEKDPRKIVDWVNKTASDESIFITPKIDGIAAELIYKNGKLVQATTRGDGIYGMDILSKIKNSKYIPRNIGRDEDLVVRGELTININDLEEFFYEREKDMHVYSERNLVMGVLSKKAIQIKKESGLRLIVYGSPVIEEGDKKDVEKGFAYLIQLGFETVFSVCSCYQTSIMGYVSFEEFLIEYWRKKHLIDYAIDGVVISYYTKKKKSQLGETKRYPNWARAFKCPDERVNTKLLNIEWTVSQKGKITPIATLEKIKTQGAVIEKACLYSTDHVYKLDLRIGDIVTVVRSGGVIPRIIGVADKKKRTGGELIPVRPPIEEMRECKVFYNGDSCL